MITDRIQKIVVTTLSQEQSELDAMTADLWSHPVVRETKYIYHHLMYNRWEHLQLVTCMSHYIARRLGADVETCVRAAVLHDIGVKGLTGAFFDTHTAKEFAAGLGESEQVQHAIYVHMWNRWPGTREAVVLILADTATTSMELASLARYQLRKGVSYMYSLFPHGVQ